MARLVLFPGVTAAPATAIGDELALLAFARRSIVSKLQAVNRDDPDFLAWLEATVDAHMSGDTIVAPTPTDEAGLLAFARRHPIVQKLRRVALTEADVVDVVEDIVDALLEDERRPTRRGRR